MQEKSQICVEGEVETDGKLNDLTTGFCGFFNPSRGEANGLTIESQERGYNNSPEWPEVSDDDVATFRLGPRAETDVELI